MPTPIYLEKYSTEDILNRLSIVFIEKGKKLMALCPFHSEKTPSFGVWKQSGYYKCYGCGANGSLDDLVTKLTGKDIYSYTGIKNDSTIPIAYGLKEVEHKNKTLRKTKYIIEGTLLNIFDNKQVLDYCWSIGFTNKFIEQFNITYSKDVKINPEGTPEDKKITFWNRIIIPCTYQSTVYNYEARDFTRRSTKKILYPLASEPDILFNYDSIDPNETVYIVEGIKGLAKIWGTYSTNVVSTFGKVLKEYQKELIKVLPKICIIPDNDSNKLNNKTGLPVDNIQETLDVYDSFYDREYEIAIIPYAGKDPNDLTRNQVAEVLGSRQKAKDILIERSKLFNRSILQNKEYMDLL